MVVHYCHGLESGPNGFKVRQLRQHFSVYAPDMKMSLWNPTCVNSFARHLLSWRWPAEALTDSFEACIEVQRTALRDGTPDVLVGSSWGGAVAAALVAEGTWEGPLVLLCPALCMRERWVGQPSGRAELSASAIISRIAALSPEVKARAVIVHGDADATVPIDDSRELSRTTGIRMVDVVGGSHGLGEFVVAGHLAKVVREVCSSLEPAAP